jgi:hypothetical protein
LRDAASQLHEHLAALGATLTALSQEGSLDADDPRSKEILHDRMSQILSLPGGSAALVSRYAGDERSAVIRPLAFLLALAVNDRAGAHTHAAAVLAMIVALRTDDPWPRLNLCTAVQRLLIFDAIAALEPPVSSALGRLLRESLAGIPPLRATAATVVADLFYRRRTELVSATDLAELQTLLLDLTDDSDELTRKEAQGLRELLEHVPPGDPG